MADVLAQQWGYLPSTDNHYDLLSNDQTSTNSEELIKNVWSEAYNVVANANVLIGHVDEAPEAIFTATNRSVIRGEAYALRAMMHFDLLRLFAPAPVVGADRRGIPVRNELREGYDGFFDGSGLFGADFVRSGDSGLRIESRSCL